MEKLILSPGLAFDDVSVISGERELVSPLLAQSLNGGVHVQEVLSGVTLLKNGEQDDACSASASSVPTYLNIVSPERKPRFTSFLEPPLGPDLPGQLHADMTMAVGEVSARGPRVDPSHSDSGKDAMWYKNYRALKVSYTCNLIIVALIEPSNTC